MIDKDVTLLINKLHGKPLCEIVGCTKPKWCNYRICKHHNDLWDPLWDNHQGGKDDKEDEQVFKHFMGSQAT
tara:strand:+ start:854 stop:1069 length:216 start_codon:yes stop_codon:yes gene_type:complete